MPQTRFSSLRAESHRCSISMCRRPPRSAPSNRNRRCPLARAAMYAHLFASRNRNHSPIQCTIADFSNSSVRASTPRPNSPQIAAPRRDSNAHLDEIRKKSRAVIRITSGAANAHARLAVREITIGQRATCTPRHANCCAMSMRATPPRVSPCAPPPQRAECSKQVAADDRRDPCVFSFEPRAIAAFAHEVAARESCAAITRDCATWQMHTSRESLGRALFNHATTALAGHEPREEHSHINANSHRIAKFPFRLDAANSNLRNRRLARLLPRSSPPRPPAFELAVHRASATRVLRPSRSLAKPPRLTRFRSPQSPRTQ